MSKSLAKLIGHWASVNFLLNKKKLSRFLLLALKFRTYYHLVKKGHTTSPPSNDFT